MATASAALVIEMMIAAAIARPAHGPSTAVIASAATRSEDATRAGPSAARYPRLASRYTTMMPAVPRPMAMGRGPAGVRCLAGRKGHVLPAFIGPKHRNHRGARGRHDRHGPSERRCGHRLAALPHREEDTAHEDHREQLDDRAPVLDGGAAADATHGNDTDHGDRAHGDQVPCNTA